MKKGNVRPLKETYTRLFGETPGGKVVNPLVEKSAPMQAATAPVKAEGPLTDDEVTALAGRLKYEGEQIADLTLALFTECNYHTLTKYLGRFFADLERNNWRIEDTSFYSGAGY